MPPEFSATLPPTGAGDLAGRVGRIKKAFRLDRAGDGQIGDAGFDHHTAIVEVDFEDPVHTAQTDQDPVGARQRATGQ